MKNGQQRHSRIAGFTAIIALLLLLSACGTSGVDIRAKFSDTKNIKEGAPVYFDGHQIGEVEDISGHEDGMMVLFDVKKEAAAKISQDAAVVVNSVKPGAPLEIYNPAGALGKSLESGQTIKGMDSMMELMAWSVGDAISEGGKELKSLVTGFTEYLKGDEFQRDKAEIQQQMKAAGDAAGEAMKSAERDFSEALSNLAVVEEQAAEAVEQLGKELSPVVVELIKNGAEFSQELEKFAQRLESASPEDKKTGQRLIQSLLATMAKLSENIEKDGVPQNDINP